MGLVAKCGFARWPGSKNVGPAWLVHQTRSRCWCRASKFPWDRYSNNLYRGHYDPSFLRSGLRERGVCEKVESEAFRVGAEFANAALTEAISDEFTVV